MPREQWELLLIDNGSNKPLADNWELSWHTKVRHVREEELGAYAVCLRGIKESNCDLLLFVDDDNVLGPDYLNGCLEIGEEWPRLGAWGGQQFPVFEGGAPPEKWKVDYWTSTLSRDVWSNNYDRQATPIGAGVCVRGRVARQYADLVSRHSVRLALGRRGTNLTSCEDVDMAFVACDLGLGVGRFEQLKLDHLMPTNRVSDEYLARITEGIGYSETVLAALRGPTPLERCRVDRVVNWYKTWRLAPNKRMLSVAFEAGRSRAIRELRELNESAWKQVHAGTESLPG